MSRIVIWQGDLDQVGSGNILDLDARAVLTTASPNGAEERASVGTGSDIVTRRTHEVRIPVSEREAVEFAEFMARDQGCAVQAMLMGSPGAEHWSWREPTLMHVSDPSGEALTLGAREIVLRSRIFRPQIGRGYDLFAPYPWAGTSATRSERLFPVAGPVLADPPSDRVGATGTSDGHILVLSDSGAVEVFAEPGLADSAAYARILGASQYDDIAYDAEVGSLFFLDVSAGQVDVLTGYDTLSSETIIGTLPIAFSLDNGGGSSFSVRSTGSDSQQFAVLHSDTRAIDVYTRTISTDTTTLQDTIDAASGSKDYDALAYQGDQLYVQRDAFDNPVLEVYDIEATTPLQPTLVQSYSDPLAQGAILAVDQMVWVMQAGTTLAEGYYDHRLQAIGGGQHVAGGWAVPRDASVDIAGTTSGVAQGTYSAYIDLVMPAMGATVQMVGATGELDGLDWLRRPILADQPGRTGIDPTLTLESDVLVSLDVDLDTPWATRARIDDTDGIPALQVTRTGPGKGVRRGAALASCDERVDQPAWQGLYEVTRFEVSGDAGDQVDIDLAGTGAGTITYIVQDSAGQTVDVVDGPDLSYALPGADTYDVVMVAQPSFAGVTAITYDGTDGDILRYDSFEHNSGSFPDLQVVKFLGGVGTLTAPAFPDSLIDLEVQGGSGTAILADVPDTTQILRSNRDSPRFVGEWVDLPDEIRELFRVGGLTGTTPAGSTPGGNLERIDLGRAADSLTVTEQGIIDDHPVPKLRFWRSQPSLGESADFGRLMAYMTTWEYARFWQGCIGDFAGHRYNDQPPLHSSIEYFRTRGFQATGAPTVWNQASSLEYIEIPKMYSQANPLGITPQNDIGKSYTEMILGDDSPDALGGVVYEGLWKHRDVLPANAYIDIIEKEQATDYTDPFHSSLSEKAIHAVAGLDIYHPSAPNGDDGIVDHHTFNHGAIYQFADIERVSSTVIGISGDVSTLPVSDTPNSGAGFIENYGRFQNGFQFRLITDTQDILFEIASATYNSGEDRTEVTIKTTGQSRAWMGDSIPIFTQAEVIGGTFIPRVDK